MLNESLHSSTELQASFVPTHGLESPFQECCIHKLTLSAGSRVLTKECVAAGVPVFMFHLVLPLRLLADVDGESRPHHAAHRNQSVNTQSPHNYTAAESSTLGAVGEGAGWGGGTHRPFSALKSLMPSAGPQIWMTSSLVSFSRSAPARTASE